MWKFISFMSFLLILQTAAQAKSCSTLESLTWLIGDWKSEDSKLKINESWKRISDKTFEGSGYTYSIEKNKIVSSETLRLVEMTGEVFYVAKVASNNLPVQLTL